MGVYLLYAFSGLTLGQLMIPRWFRWTHNVFFWQVCSNKLCTTVASITNKNYIISKLSRIWHKLWYLQVLLSHLLINVIKDIMHIIDENECMGMYTASAEPCLSSLIVLLIGLCICNLNVKKGIFSMQENGMCFDL